MLVVHNSEFGEALNNNKAILCTSLYEVASHAKNLSIHPLLLLYII